MPTKKIYVNGIGIPFYHDVASAVNATAEGSFVVVSDGSLDDPVGALCALCHWKNDAFDSTKSFFVDRSMIPRDFQQVYQEGLVKLRRADQVTF